MYESLDGRSAIDLAQKFKRLVKSDKAAEASAPHRQQERAQRGASAFKAAVATASAATTSTGGHADGDADMDNDDDDEFTVPRTGRDQRAHSRVLALTASKHPQKLGAVESLMERARQRVAEAADNIATATTTTLVKAPAGQRVARVRDDKERAPRAVAVPSASRRPERLKFTKEEEDRLTTLVGVHGNQWACVMQTSVCCCVQWHTNVACGWHHTHLSLIHFCTQSAPLMHSLCTHCQGYCLFTLFTQCTLVVCLHSSLTSRS